jgi:EAL domain-containing protein (putative c-di-GMP-specific phosphodiesterase class I)
LRCIVVAEGVEHKQEAEWLVGLGTRFGQGFHFAEPKRWLRASNGCVGNVRSSRSC